MDSRETTQVTYSGASTTMEPDRCCEQQIREDCSESGIGIYFNPEMNEAGMCRDYEEIPFQKADAEMENAVEDLQEQSERRKKQMQSLVQKQDELMTENYQLKQKLNTMQNSMERMEEKYNELTKQMRKAMQAIEKLKSRSDDDDDDNKDDKDDKDDGDDSRRRCDGFTSFGSCYELTEQKMNYNDANVYCKREGGILATWSDDQSVHRQLVAHASEQGISSNEYIWIGAFYNPKTEKSMWADGREVDIKVTRFTKQTSCGAVFKRYIAGFKCANKYRAWCQFDNRVEM